MQATPEHTFGPSCHFAPNVNSPYTSLSIKKGEEDLPPLKAQFFYASPFPINDPLCALPTPGTSESTNQTPLPFNSYDNNALEEAWQNLSADEKRRAHQRMEKAEVKAQAQALKAARKAARRTRTADGIMTDELREMRAKACSDISRKHAEKHARELINRDQNAVPSEGAPLVSTYLDMVYVSVTPLQ